jgi:hypothetical protein
MPATKPKAPVLTDDPILVLIVIPETDHDWGHHKLVHTRLGEMSWEPNAQDDFEFIPFGDDPFDEADYS